MKLAGKRILLSCNTSWGLVHFRGRLIRRLQQEGAKVAALAPEDAHSERLAGLVESYEAFAMDAKGTNPLRDCRTLLDYRQCFQRIWPDLILQYTIKPILYGSLAARSLGIPVLNVVTGLGTGFLQGKVLQWVVQTLYRGALHGNRPVLFVNAEDRDYFLRHRLIRKEQANLLPGEGVDLERFRWSEVPIRERDELRVVYCGRFLADKGIRELVEAVRQVREAGVNLKLDLVGFTETTNPTGIPEAELGQWRDHPGIHVHPPTDEIAPFLRRAHAAVLPSYREGLPLQVLEAFAIGRPVLATDVAGCRELVEEGRNGWSCQPRSSAALAERLREMAAESTAELQRKGLAGREKVVSGYGDEAVWQRYALVLGKSDGE